MQLTRRQALRAAGAWAGAGLLEYGLRGRAAHAQAAKPVQPNFVVVFADDLGYGDIGCFGNQRIRTPNIDRMASEGTRFTSFYSCAPVCTPSRAGLLTGRYPIRTGLNNVLFPGSTGGISPDETTLAEALKVEGYATSCIGKWHLGHLPPYLPTRHGFDRYFGIPYSNDMDKAALGHPPIPLMRQEAIIEQPANQDTLTRRYTEEALAFLRDHGDRPFFLYLAHSMPHVPIHASDAFRGKSSAGLYGDVIEELDWSVGQILDALRQTGLDKNTLVLFTSDNGPWLSQGDQGGSAGPLRSGKGTTFEGGVREPCVAWWPGRVPAGRVENAPAITLDMLPTFVRLAGASPPADRPIDGRDISDLLFGKGRRTDEEFFFYRGRTLEAHRNGPWKLKRPFSGQVYGEHVEHPALLFNLDDDIGEQNNLADQHPDIVQRLEARMLTFEQSLSEPSPTVK